MGSRAGAELSGTGHHNSGRSDDRRCSGNERKDFHPDCDTQVVIAGCLIPSVADGMAGERPPRAVSGDIGEHWPTLWTFLWVRYLHSFADALAGTDLQRLSWRGLDRAGFKAEWAINRVVQDPQG